MHYCATNKKIKKNHTHLKIINKYDTIDKKILQNNLSIKLIF